MLIVILACDHLMEIAVCLAVACDVFDGVFFMLSFFPRDVFDEIWDLIGSASEGFLFLIILSKPKGIVTLMNLFVA